MAMTLEKGLEYLKDGIDCQIEGARSLKAVMRAYPELKGEVQRALDSMERVKADVRTIEVELKRVAADGQAA
jgi:hypothetical protein